METEAMKMLKGINVYDGNGKIDWTKVKGIDFVIMKTGEGTNGKQKRFEYNYSGCKAAGLSVGAFQYCRASTTAGAAAEAKALLTWVKGKTFELPLYYDIEGEAREKLSASTLNGMVKAWLDVIKAAGYVGGLYTNPCFLKYHYDETTLPKCEMWIAQCNSKSLTAEKYGGVWQYVDKGSCVGINGAVNCNISYKDYTARVQAPTAVKLTKLMYFPACPKTASTISIGLSYIGVDTGFAYREKIAKANGIASYTGTTEQNAKLLTLLKAGKLVIPK
jgi:GH25 family lysozyme M1 (1,4-beta-N-acetylmuramidase)